MFYAVSYNSYKFINASLGIILQNLDSSHLYVLYLQTTFFRYFEIEHHTNGENKRHFWRTMTAEE